MGAGDLFDYFGNDIFDVDYSCGCCEVCLSCEVYDVNGATSYLNPEVDNTGDHYSSVYSK